MVVLISESTDLSIGIGCIGRKPNPKNPIFTVSGLTLIFNLMSGPFFDQIRVPVCTFISVGALPLCVELHSIAYLIA